MGIVLSRERIKIYAKHKPIDKVIKLVYADEPKLKVDVGVDIDVVKMR